MTQQKDERRNLPRYSCNFLATVTFLPDAGGNVRTPVSGECDNVSLAGALVVLPETVALGSGVRVVFTTRAVDAAAGTSPIETLALVAWVLQSLVAPLRHQHGLKFLRPEPDLVKEAWPGRVLAD